MLTAQGYRRAMAGIALPNPASVRLHERAGFVPVGVYRGGLEAGRGTIGWWQRGLAPADVAPSPPTPLTALPAGVLDAALAAGGVPR